MSAFATFAPTIYRQRRAERIDAAADRQGHAGGRTMDVHRPDAPAEPAARRNFCNRCARRSARAITALAPNRPTSTGSGRPRRTGGGACNCRRRSSVNTPMLRPTGAGSGCFHRRSAGSTARQWRKGDTPSTKRWCRRPSAPPSTARD